MKLQRKVDEMVSQAKYSFPNFFPPEITREPEEPDSAFEATRYFFEDITPETSIGTKPRATFFFLITFLLL